MTPQRSRHPMVWPDLARLAVVGLLLAAQPSWARGRQPAPRVFYVSPDGSDQAEGSRLSPWASPSRAIEELRAGDTVVLRAGRYVCPETLRLRPSGTAAAPITIQSDGNDVVLDFAPVGGGDRGIQVEGDYWHLEGLIVQHAGDNGVIVYGDHNILQEITARANGDSGIQLHSGAGDNVILDCDSLENYDPENHGENADGFAAKFGLDPGNVFIGCRAWHNSDDGYDFWQAGQGVTLVHCWAFRNGLNRWADPAYQGDGNGFKLGHGSGAHVLIGCVAAGNPANGIDVNGNETGVTVLHATCVANGGRNFYFDEHNAAHLLRNSLSADGSVLMYPEIDDRSNTWNGFGTRGDDLAGWDVDTLALPRALERPFSSVDQAILASVWVGRDPNNPVAVGPSRRGLPHLPTLRLAADSHLIDRGQVLGLPWWGQAPDLGAFERLAADSDDNGVVDCRDLQRFAEGYLRLAGRVVQNTLSDLTDLGLHWQQAWP